ncbi:MAG: hypothetical protein EON54_12250, partial [Alcaligenaceae bacterium]
MAKQNDQIFQLSLTEIAFTISFILLLLLGYLVVKEQAARLAAEEALAGAMASQTTASALATARQDLAATVHRAGLPVSDEIISKLVEAAEARGERDRLKTRVEDLDAQLTALTTLQQQLLAAGQSVAPSMTKEKIATALALEHHVRQLYSDGDSASDRGSDTPSPAFARPSNPAFPARTADTLG